MSDKLKYLASTIMKYKKPCEDNFGVLRFETVKPSGSLGGRPSQFVWLNEDQSISNSFL